MIIAFIGSTGFTLGALPALSVKAAVAAEANNNIDPKEFYSARKRGPVYFENTHYLRADKGGEKPYRLVSEPLVLQHGGDINPAVPTAVSASRKDVIPNP